MLFAGSLKAEFEELEREMAQEIRFKSAKMEDITDINLDVLDQQLCPGIVLAVSKLAGSVDKTQIKLASLLQYVFLAHHIHRRVTDEELPEHQRQYPVLVGDFMFGQTFLKICDKILFPYAGEFVKAIEAVNEGVVTRWRLKNRPLANKDLRQIIGLERASLTALAGKLGARLAGMKEPHNTQIEELGYAFGMIWGAWHEPDQEMLAQEYLDKAEGILAELKDTFAIKPLIEIVDYLRELTSHGNMAFDTK